MTKHVEYAEAPLTRVSVLVVLGVVTMALLTRVSILVVLGVVTMALLTI